MDQPIVMDALQQLRRTVCRVVIHHDDIILEVCLLIESAIHGVADGLLTVIDGNHDGCFDVKLLFVEVRPTVIGGVDLRADLRQMDGRGLFHLDLYLTVTWVHVVKLLHARGTRVGLFLGIEFLVDVEDTSVPAQEEAKGIESCMLIGVLLGL